MTAQISAVAIFVIMFGLIVLDKIERHIITLVCGAATLIVVFGVCMKSTDAIIENKIKRVVIGTLDTNPLVGGKGMELLKQAGIEVTLGILEDDCKSINEIFFHYT